jgi:hypothetical protein
MIDGFKPDDKPDDRQLYKSKYHTAEVLKAFFDLDQECISKEYKDKDEAIRIVNSFNSFINRNKDEFGNIIVSRRNNKVYLIKKGN